MNDTAIKIENLTKKYTKGKIGASSFARDAGYAIAGIFGKKIKRRDEFLALDSVNAEIKKGEVVGIIGANGAGKSTLLKILCRITAPSEGRVIIDGSVSGMLEIGAGFHSELTGRENIFLNGSILGMRKSEIEKRIDDIIEFSECGEFIDTPVKRYSSGMYVKLAFAVCAFLNSDIVILDEVLAVGDEKFKEKCLDRIQKIASDEKKTVLFVSHSMASVRRICQRVIVLSEGKMVFDGDTEEGIETYLSKNSSFGRIDYTKENPYADYADDSPVKLEALEADKYTVSDSLNLTLSWLDTDDYDRGGVRFSVLDASGNAVSSAVFRDKFESRKGERRSCRCSIDTKDLIDGKYYILISLFKTDVRTKIFVTARGFSFEKADISRKDAEKWRASTMGSIVMKAEAEIK